MTRMDRVFLWLVFAPVLPILLFLAGWWGSLPLAPENRIVVFCLLGLALGIAADFLFLKKLLARGYQQPLWLLAGVYGFYMIGLFGFQMGVPLLNVLPGLVAGFYAGRQALLAGWDEPTQRLRLRQVTRFSLAVLAVICAVSAWLALSDPTTGRNLQGMLGLEQEVTRPMLWGIILIGGALLLVLQVILVRLGARLAHRLPIAYDSSPAYSRRVN
ncbi:MAG: hypothetical protein LLG44_04485 [Chloroflexi bacterium]|nr:hypothetical protein [Chloroflexota bacterium]